MRVCACVRMGVRECVHECVCVSECVCECVCFMCIASFAGYKTIYSLYLPC